MHKQHHLSCILICQLTLFFLMFLTEQRSLYIESRCTYLGTYTLCTYLLSYIRMYFGKKCYHLLTLFYEKCIRFNVCVGVQVRAKNHGDMVMLTRLIYQQQPPTIIASCFSFVAVMTDYLPVRIQSEPVLKFNTGVLRCQVPQSAASYTKVISWTRGSARLYPSPRGGKICLKIISN